MDDEVSTFRLVLRRWPILLAGLLVTGAAVAGAIAVIPIEYQSRASVLLVPPVSKPGDNPYLSLSGMKESTEVLSRAMTDDETRAKLASDGVVGSARYQVDPDAVAAGPLVLVLASGKSPEQARADRDLIVDLIPTRLGELQDQLNVPDSSQITSTVLTQDKETEVVYKSLLRAVIAAVAVGVVLTALVIALVENVARRRRVAAARELETAADPPDHRPSSPHDAVEGIDGDDARAWAARRATTSSPAGSSGRSGTRSTRGGDTSA